MIMKNYKVKEGYVLVLRTNNKNNQSYNGFQYPTKGYVEAPDWEPTGECGNGLHGALKGVGDGYLFNWDENAIWMVLEVKKDEIVDLDGKIKFRGGEVIYCGNRQEATQLLYNVYGNIGIVGLKINSNKNDVVKGGDFSILRGGNNSILISKDYSTLTGEYHSTLIGGKNSTLIGGYGSTIIGGDDSCLIGEERTFLVGGYGSTLIGGKGSVLEFKFWTKYHYITKIYHVGEEGIKPNTKYRLNDRFEIEEVE